MADKSAIEWTDATWNPVTGCTKVSPGCKNCYAERFAERFRGVAGHPYEQGFDVTLHPDRIDLPLRWKEPRRVFVNSMSDLFHEGVPNSFIHQVLMTMILACRHVYQVLTKRPERMQAYISEELATAPPPHIWLGTSAEDQDRFDERWEHLRRTPAAVRFLSLEPLLGPIDLRLRENDVPSLHWVIVGGESGPGARPMRKEWVVDLRDQCHRASVPFFFKQWGGVFKSQTGRRLEGHTYDELPATAAAR